MVRLVLGVGVTAVAVAVLMFAGRRFHAAGHERAWDARVAVLRAYAEPAARREARGDEADALRRELQELGQDVRVLLGDQALAVRAVGESLSSAELERQRAWVERAETLLDRWLSTEGCGTPPAAWPLRVRVEARLRRGERIAAECARLVELRAWSRLLAWRAWLDAQAPGDDPALTDPADDLAAAFSLAWAFDDGSLFSAMVRVALEDEVLRAARALLHDGRVSAHALRTALEPWLVRSLAVEPRELVEGELFWFLERSLGRARPDETAHIGAQAADALLVRFGSVERAFDLARLSAPDLEQEIERRRDAVTPEPSFTAACLSAFTTLHAHRSVCALARADWGP